MSFVGGIETGTSGCIEVLHDSVHVYLPLHIRSGRMTQRLHSSEHTTLVIGVSSDVTVRQWEQDFNC